MLTKRDMLARLRTAVDAAGGVRPFCRKHRISPAYVSKATRGEMTFGPKIARALNVVAVEGWVERP